MKEKTIQRAITKYFITPRRKLLQYFLDFHADLIKKF